MGYVEQKISSLKLQRIFNLTLVLFLIVLVVVSLDVVRTKVKDTKRRADIKQLQTALEMYQARFNKYPDVRDKDIAEWDSSFEPAGQPQQFLSLLEAKKVVDRVPRDPVNNKIYFYRYSKYPAGSYGCSKPFYILQIMNFEGVTDNHGSGQCPERNFAAEAPNGYTVQVFQD